MYQLFLDDERIPEDVFWINIPKGDYVIVRTAEQFKQYIQEHGLPSHVSFDHDLGDDPNGYDCAKWLVNYCIETKQKFPSYTVHSQNPIGKDNIIGYIDNYKRVYGESAKLTFEQYFYIAEKKSVHDPVRPGILKRQTKGKMTCSKARALKSKQKNKGNNTAKAAQRFLNYHC